MTDELTNINTAHLTAAVNLLHKPLNDGPQSDYDGEDKKKGKKKRQRVQKPRKRKIKKIAEAEKETVHIHIEDEVTEAIISIPDTSDHHHIDTSANSDFLHEKFIPHSDQMNNDLVVHDAHEESITLQQENAAAFLSDAQNEHLQSNVTNLQSNISSVNTENQLSEHISQISPQALKQLLSCISPLTVPENLQAYEAQTGGLKLSLENLLVQQNDQGTHNLQTDITNGGALSQLQSEVEESDTPGHVQISAALLQNLLQGINNPQLHGAARIVNPQNTPLPPIQQFASQSVHSLIQNLAGQGTSQFSSQNANQFHSGSLNPAVFTLGSTSLHQVQTFAQPISTQIPTVPPHPNTSVLPISSLLHQHHFQQNQQPAVQNMGSMQPVKEGEHNFQSLQIVNNILNRAGSQPLAGQNTGQSAGQTAGDFSKAEQIGIPTTSTLSTHIPVSQVHGLPLLLQPSGPGGRMQLIPLDRGVNLPLLQEIIQKYTVNAVQPFLSTVAVSSPQHTVLNSASLQTNNQTFENLVQAANLSVIPKHVTELDSTIHSHNKSGGNLSQGSLNQSSDNNQHSTNNDLNFESRNTSEDNDTSRSSAVLTQHYENISTDTVTESQKNMAIMHYTVPQANTNVTSAAEYMSSVMPALSQSHPTHFPLESSTAHPNQHPHQLTTVPQHNMCLQPQFQNQHHTFQESSSQPHIQHPVLLNSLTLAQNSQHSIPSNNNLLSCHGSFPGQIPTQTSTMSETYPLNSYQPSQNTLQSYHNSQQSPHNVPSYSHESDQLSHDTLPPVLNSNTDEKLQQQEDVHSNEPAIANDRSPDYRQQQEEEHSGPAFPTRIENNRCVFCVDCNKLLPTGCKVHNTEYLYQADTPVLSRARTSLPPCFTLQHTGSSEHPDLMGVWCKECLSERTIFGPMVGQQLKLTNTEFAEQAYGFQPFLLSKGEHETKLLHMVDENICNWMMFVRYAPSLLEQNCTVYRDGDHFYFVTKTEIKEEELLVWFSAEMCLILGITQNPGNHHFHQCEDCGLNFLIKRLLNAHLKSKHPEKYRYNVACYICNKRFKSRRNLMSHLATHMYVKPHSCQYCKKQFADISNLRQHLLIHTGEKNFACDECGKKFRQKAHLENHVVVHTGDKSFNCPHCDASFGRRSDLKVHTYKHTKEVYHPCNVCGKEFFKMQNLKKHLKVHTGERNYMCDKCFKGFQTKYHRDRHLNVCKEKNGKEPSYMSLEEFAKLDSTCDAVPLKKVSDDHEI